MGVYYLMFIRNLLLISLLLFGCKKELSITDFTNDYNFYNSEIRIEALILPSDNTAIIRIDRSTRLDEGLNEEGYYNCEDDDNDWNYYYCTERDTSYEMKSQCTSDCNDECILHFYSCDSDSTTFVDRLLCVEYCTEGKCITDDVGNDGKAFDDIGFGGEAIGVDLDGSEGDGNPDCGEPNVDEFDEFLPGIHIEGCQVFITQETDSCHFVFHEDGGNFFQNVKFGDDFFNSELVSYGAWLPDLENCNVPFNRFEKEYSLSCDCSSIEGFESFGKITASDTLQRPVVFFHEKQLDNLLLCTEFDENESIFDCMQAFGISDSSFAELSYVDYNNIDCARIQWHAINQGVSVGENCENADAQLVEELILTYLLDSLNTDFDNLDNPIIRYASLRESNTFQAVEYIFNQSADEWIYFHSHPDIVTNQAYMIDDKINYWSQTIIPEKYRDESYTVLADSFKYDIFTFSKGYENYYFYDQLDLKDPVRTNLRDENGKTIMGAFGAMARNTIKFKVISADSILWQ
jgi:hypothetical protein